jgi:hypothetical protein
MLAGPFYRAVAGNDCLSLTHYAAVVHHTLTHLEVKVIMNLHIPKASIGFFLLIFKSITCLKKPVFIRGIFCHERYQPACHYF